MTREGTASTKTRYEIRGSAKKIRPQKGSGHARLGDKKSPMLRGGGVAFGPKPRDFATGLQKKVYDLAWRTALSYRFRKGELIIVDNTLEIESPSSKLLNDIFNHHKRLLGKGRSLLVTLEDRPLLQDALDDMDRGQQALTWDEVDVKNLLELSRVIIERDALHNILLTHQEDITNTSIPPWHKSLIHTSSPSDLEQIIGWSEFRNLHLTPTKDQPTARPIAYENVALKQYSHASSLPENSTQRATYTHAAYTLLAEAKELQFAQLTNTSWAEYTKETTRNPDSAHESFPAFQALQFQREVKLDAKDTAGQTSQLESDILDLEARALEIKQLDMRRKAALLAAQVHEHRAEAIRLGGDEEGAEELRGLASGERTTVEEVAGELVEAKLARAKVEVRVESARGDWAGKVKAEKKAERLEKQIEKRRREEEEMYADERVEEEGVVEVEGGEVKKAEK